MFYFWMTILTFYLAVGVKVNLKFSEMKRKQIYREERYSDSSLVGIHTTSKLIVPDESEKFKYFLYEDKFFGSVYRILFWVTMIKF